MGCAGSTLNKTLRAELECAGETVVIITFGLVSGGTQWKGLRSKGVGQLNGNCVLALTDKRLVSRGLPGLGSTGDLSIDRTKIKGASLTKKCPGGVSGFDVVKVDYEDAGGNDEAAHFLTTVGTQAKWVKEINAARRFGVG